MKHHWFCLTCNTTGTYVDPDTITDTSPPAKHGHASFTTTSSAFAERYLARAVGR